MPDTLPEVVADGNSEFVLKRDGTDVKVNDACAATSGTWKSPYDDGTWTQASDVDIDHMVPLKNAWIVSVSIIPLPMACRLTPAVGRLGVDHGAAQGFANDITRPQLWAVTDNVNQAKSDQSPDEWKPPLTSFYCTYAKSWVQVKSYYKLTITDAEKGALSGMLDKC